MTCNVFIGTLNPTHFTSLRFPLCLVLTAVTARRFTTDSCRATGGWNQAKRTERDTMTSRDAVARRTWRHVAMTSRRRPVMT